eukprot:m.46387 g.46387  ORF g.46387 m.46387 type:complete len:588 (+) comp10366_c0_seq2:222-1985(+)
MFNFVRHVHVGALFLFLVPACHSSQASSVVKQSHEVSMQVVLDSRSDSHDEKLLGKVTELLIIKVLKGTDTDGNEGKRTLLHVFKPIALHNVVGNIDVWHKHKKLPIRESKSGEIGIAWNVEYDFDANDVLQFRIMYTLKKVLRDYPRNMYLSANVTSLRFAFDPVVAASMTDPDEVIQIPTSHPNKTASSINVSLVNWGDEERYPVCARRPYMLLTQSIGSVPPCMVCAGTSACKEIASFIENTSTTNVLTVENIAEDKGLIVMEYSFATVLPSLSLVSQERGAGCRRVLYSPDAPFLARVAGDILFPMKVFFVFLPVGMALMYMGIRCVERGAGFLFTLCVALGSAFVDYSFFGLALVFPVCSFAVSFWGHGVISLITLAAYYTGCYFTFRYLDDLLADKFPLPPTLRALHATNIYRMVSSSMPQWLPLAPLLGVLFIIGLFGSVGLFDGVVVAYMFSLLFTVLSCAALLPILKDQIKAYRKAGKTMNLSIGKAIFLLYLCLPFIVLLLMYKATYNVTTTFSICTGLFGFITAFSLRASTHSHQHNMQQIPIWRPDVALPSKLESADLRPKQRKLLEEQIAEIAT